MGGLKAEDHKLFFGNYRGQVMNNVDPNKWGRCQIKYIPMFKDIATVDLPWSVPAPPIFDGAGVGFGTSNIPKINTYVYGWFLAGDIYQPRHSFEAPTAQNGVPIEANTNYPNRKVWKTQAGNLVTMDENGDIKIKNSVGVGIELSSTGVVTITGDDGALITVDSAGNMTVHATTVNFT